MLVLERQREPVDDRAEDLEELRDTVVPLRLVDERVEDVVDRLADEGAVRHELAVDAVQDRLEVVALARVLRVEQLEQPEEEVGVEVALDDLWVRLVAHDEAQQELVHVLQVRPRGLEGRLVLLRVVGGRAGLPARRERAEEVRLDHLDHLGEGLLVEDVFGRVDVVDELEQLDPLDLLALHVDHDVREVDGDAAQLELADEQVLPLRHRHVCARRARRQGKGQPAERAAASCQGTLGARWRARLTQPLALRSTSKAGTDACAAGALFAPAHVARAGSPAAAAARGHRALGAGLRRIAYMPRAERFALIQSLLSPACVRPCQPGARPHL